MYDTTASLAGGNHMGKRRDVTMSRESDKSRQQKECVRREGKSSIKEFIYFSTSVPSRRSSPGRGFIISTYFCWCYFFSSYPFFHPSISFSFRVSKHVEHWKRDGECLSHSIEHWTGAQPRKKRTSELHINISFSSNIHTCNIRSQLFSRLN